MWHRYTDSCSRLASAERLAQPFNLPFLQDGEVPIGDGQHKAADRGSVELPRFAVDPAGVAPRAVFTGIFRATELSLHELIAEDGIIRPPRFAANLIHAVILAVRSRGR